MPNRTIPEFLKDDLTLNSLTPGAQLLFYKIHHIIEDSHRFKIGPSPKQPLLLHASLYALTRVRISNVASYLSELQKAGAVLVRDSERGWYGEIAEHLRYHSEDYAKGVPRLGPRAPKTTSQSELPLGPVGALPDVPKPPHKSKPNVSDSDNGNDHVSGVASSRKRELSPGKDAEKRKAGVFAIARNALDDPLWHRLWDAAGKVEMHDAGMKWIRRFTFERETIQTLLSDLEGNPEKILEPAAWLEAAWQKSPAGQREKKRA